MLPESVLSRAAAEIMDYHGSGQSVMEMSHRSKVFEEIMDEAQNLFRSVLSVPDNYDILLPSGFTSFSGALKYSAPKPRKLPAFYHYIT